MERLKQVPQSVAPISIKSRGYVLSSWRHFLITLCTSLLYATALAALPIDAFKDRENYLRYAERSPDLIDKFLDLGVLPLFANEPLWLSVNALLSQVFPPEFIVRALIFFSAFTVSFVMLRGNGLRRNGKNILWLTLFLLSPQIMKDFVIHLRQGLGLSVFLLGYYAKPALTRALLMASAGLIHSSFLIVCAIGATAALTKKISSYPLLRISFVVGLSTVGIFSLLEIANFIGARQGLRYAEIAIETSGLGFLLWAGVFLVLVTGGSQFLKEHIFAVSMLGCYLGAYFLTPLAARIFESGLPLVLTAGLLLKPLHKLVFLSIFLFYSGYVYITSIGSPWLGWGA